MNLYGYVTGDPVNKIDPLGLWDYCAGGSSSANSEEFLIEMDNCFNLNGYGGWSLSPTNFNDTGGGSLIGPQLPLKAFPDAPQPCQIPMLCGPAPKAPPKPLSPICGFAADIPGNRIRVGADAAVGLGGIIGGGLGLSLEDSGRVVFDRYGVGGPGLAATAGGSISIDSNTTPDGWSSQKGFNLQGSYIISLSYSNSNGVENGGAGIGAGPKLGALVGYLLNSSYGSTLIDFNCD